MSKPTDPLMLAAALAVAACGQSGTPAGRDAASRQKAAPRMETLTAKGISPGLTFGMARAGALAAARAAFGSPTGKDHVNECGEGALDFVSFHDLQLAFDDGGFAGWSLGGATPALRTAGGLAIGAPRRALGGARVDEEGSLGPEFEVNGVGGILDSKGARVEALWAGVTCQLR